MKGNQKLGLTMLTALVFSSMVGAGVFSLPQNMAEVAGVDAIITAWFITGIGIMLLAGCFLYLSRLKPDLDGGIYTYAREGFGEVAGFISAWGYWLCATIGVVGYLVVAFAGLGALLDTPEHIIFGDGNTLSSFIGASLVLWSVHYLVLRGVKQAALINLLATIAKALPLLAFIVVAYWAFEPATFHYDRAGESLNSPFIDQVKNTMLITLWVFTGIEGAIVLSLRARKRNDIGKATFLGVLFALVLYVAVTLLALGVMSRSDVAGLSNPSMAGIMAHLAGGPGRLLISLGLIVSVLASYLSWILYAAEVPYIASQHGAFPKRFTRANERGTATHALMLTSCTIQFCLLMILFTGESYNALVLLSTSMILIPYFLVGAYLVKVAFKQQLSWRITLVGMGASLYGIWLIYAAGLDTLLLSSVLYLPGLILFFSTRRKAPSAKLGEITKEHSS
ncbi:basic amino acid/polyamine antiporter [Vibrio cincinnatiensis]|uniref:basic amino acid/polyamine antiporter n=1 Tax=Vibrio cincinnatiensis TaxID=675 RepID=UPI001EDE02F9|nr:basic amino acid/polyamine antiporter [Vibrio cincinnatiensis]MCG3745991.1 amino acid permease [Vibrio cincinnatiensis]